MVEREMLDTAASLRDANKDSADLSLRLDRAARLLEQAARRTTPDREAIIDSILAKLDPMIRPGIIDEPYHSERNGLITAWNVVASSKTTPASDKGGA